MPESTSRSPVESRLRRWWDTLCAACEAMEMTEYEYMANRIEHLEERLSRLEAAQVPPSPAPSSPSGAID